MEIKQDVVDYVGSLGKLNKQFFDYAVIQKKALSHTDLVQASAGKLSTYSYKISVWPYFINAERTQEIANASIGIAHLIHQMLKRKWQQGQSLHSFYDLDEDTFSRVIQVSYNGNVMGRADAYHDGEHFKLLELNLGTNVGGSDMVYFVDAHLKQPQLAEFLAQKPAFTFLNTYEKLIENALAAMAENQLQDESGEYNLLIRNRNMDPELAKVYVASYQALAQKLGYALNVFVIDHEDKLEYNEKGVVYQGKQIGYLLWLPLEHEAQGMYAYYPEPLKQAWMNQQVLVPSSALTKMLENKANFALLHAFKNDGTFSEEEIALINNHVPWTGWLQPKSFGCSKVSQPNSLPSMQTLRENKADYVLKPDDGLQGKGITVGRYVDEQTWQAALQNAAEKDNYLVQSYVAAKKVYGLQSEGEIGEYEPVWGAFFCGQLYSGVWLRLMPEIDGFTGVVNSAQGAHEAIVYQEI